MTITKRMKNDVVIFDVDGEIKRSDITDTTLHDLVKVRPGGGPALHSPQFRESRLHRTASASARSWPVTSPPTTWAAKLKLAASPRSSPHLPGQPL